MTKWFVLLLALLLRTAALTAANAQESYPTRPIRLILPFPPGGAVDHVARLVTVRAAENLGQPFVMENKAGAGGVIATDATAKARPDGYTLLLTTPNHTISAALNAKLPYDAEKDLVPVSVVAEVPELLVSHPSAPFETFAGFVEYAKQNPGKLNYPGYEGILWIGVVAPAGIPTPVIAKLASAFQHAVATVDLAERLKRDGVEPVGGTPEAFGALMASEIAQWRELGRAAGITLD